MKEYKTHAIENMINGWTRIDMLLTLYDRTLDAIRMAEAASQAGDQNELALRLVESNKYILALHSGLNPEDTVAADIGRLLTFVMLRLEERNFSEASHFVEKLRATFEQIRVEASALEKEGKIPALNTPQGLNTVA